MKDSIFKYIMGKVVARGIKDDGNPVDWSMTQEGHGEVAIHDPLLPFGSIHTENMMPIFQTDPVYGINPEQISTSVQGTGSATASDSYFIASTGTTVNSFASIQSQKRLRYRPGQGAIARFAGLFSAGVANSYQIMGIGHPEDGYYFGYVGTTFGILHVNRGVRETRTLTITTASSNTENITITLNGTAYTVAVTNSANIQRTVWEISQGTYAGWSVEAIGATVRFVANSAGAKTGTYSITATSAQGTYARTKAGANSTDTFIPQSSWNGDTLDGNGTSGITISPQKGNVYQIGFQYLGQGCVIFKVLVASNNKNNPIWTIVHVIKNPNALTATHVGNPSFPFTMAAYSSGSTTDISVKSGSFAGFIEGNKKLHGNRFTYVNTITTVGATNLQAIFTFKNDLYYGGRANQSVINLLAVSGAVKHTFPVIYYLIRNGSLAGNPNFTALSTGSCSSWDTSATTVTYSDNSQLIWTGHLGETGEIDHHFGNSGGSEEITLQPGEWVTLAARAVTGNPNYVSGSINTREDQ